MTWLGSGIYAETIEVEEMCGAPQDDGSTCDFDGTVEINLDDYGQGGWTCPQCGEEFSFDVNNYYDDAAPWEL